MARIGLLIPSSNTVIETDFIRNAQQGVTVHTARMYMEDTTVEGESRMLDEFAEPAARDIGTARPHIALFGCTSAGALRGNAYDSELCKRLSDAANSHVVSTIRSVSEAIHRRHLSRVGVVTPYTAVLNERIKESLEDTGVEVVKISGLGITENFTIAGVNPAEIAEFAERELADLDIDGVFISCTNFRSWEAAPSIQQAMALPVLTSNMAAFEAVTAGLGVVS